MDDQELDVARKRANRNGAAVQARSSGTPGRSTLTHRMPASAASIARAVVTQLRAGGAEPAAAEVHALAAHGLSGAGGSVPHLDAIQRSFGHHDLSGVQAHGGGRAEQAAVGMGAHAYASGNQVAFAKAPDVHLAAHELAHVVQQRGGVRLAGGVGREGDPYERHADAVADLVVQGKSAEGLLDTMAHRGSTGGAAVQQYASTDRVESQVHLTLAIGRATPTQADDIAAQLQAGLDAHTPTVHLHFLALEEPYDLVVTRAAALTAVGRANLRAMTSDAEEMCEAPPTTAPHAGGRGSSEIQSGGATFTGGIAAAIAAMAGPEGTEQELEMRLNVPIPALSPAARLSGALTLRLAHERVGSAHGHDAAEPSTFQVEADVQLGGGVDVGVFEARLMGGFQVEAHGVDPAHCASMLLLALEHRLHEVNVQLANLLFGHDFDATALRGMAEGDSADLAGTVSVEGRIGAPEGAGDSALEASAGLSHHYVTERGEHGIEEHEYTMFDASGHVAADGGAAGGFDGWIEAHLPVGRGAREAEAEVEIRARGHVHASGAQAMIFDTVTSLIGLLLTQLEHAPGDPSDAATRLRRVQAAIGDLSSAASGAIARQAHETASSMGEHGDGGSVGIELVIGFEGGTPHVSLRAVHEVEAEVAHIGEVRYERMTEIPIRIPPGFVGVGAASSEAP